MAELMKGAFKFISRHTLHASDQLISRYSLEMLELDWKDDGVAITSLAHCVLPGGIPSISSPEIHAEYVALAANSGVTLWNWRNSEVIQWPISVSTGKISLTPSKSYMGTQNGRALPPYIRNGKIFTLVRSHPDELWTLRPFHIQLASLPGVGTPPYPRHLSTERKIPFPSTANYFRRWFPFGDSTQNAHPDTLMLLHGSETVVGFHLKDDGSTTVAYPSLTQNSVESTIWDLLASPLDLNCGLAVAATAHNTGGYVEWTFFSIAALASGPKSPMEERSPGVARFLVKLSQSEPHDVGTGLNVDLCVNSGTMMCHISRRTGRISIARFE